MSKNNTIAYTGLGLILVTALALAFTAAYQSIVGLADLFAARVEVVVVMAIFIEWAKLLFAGALHMFWRTLSWWKWLGVGIVAVHMAVTNIGIYAYLSSGYTLQKAPVAAIERQVDVLRGSLTSHSTIEQEAVTRITAMDTAYRKYVEELYVRRAEQYKRDNAELRGRLERQRDEARVEMRRIESEIIRLEEARVEKAAKLGSIEHISAFVGEDPEDVLKVVALFTLLLMLGLDPAALLMVVLFTSLLSKKMKHDRELELAEANKDPIEQLDEDTKAAVEHLNEIGYLERRKGKKQ